MNQLTLNKIEETKADLKLAHDLADAKLIPDHFRKSPGDCYIAINLAKRFGMDPWSVMQELYIISGRPMMSGKMAIAILNHSLAEPLRPEYTGDGDERTITLSGRSESDANPVSVTLKVRDAKTNNEQWKKNPDQMLMYAGARMWGRRYAPDILLGIVFDDEDLTSSTDRALNASFEKSLATARTPIASPKPDIIDELTGEVLDSPAPLPMKADEKPYDWGVRFVAAFRTSPDIDTVDGWLAANADTMAVFEKSAPKVHGNLTKAVSEFKMELLNQGEGT